MPFRCLVALLAAMGPAAAEPVFTERNELVRPAGYQEWVLIGASLGMSYTEASERPAAQEFHHVYLEPAAFRRYKETGAFPEGTVLVMEVYSAGERESINRQGRFADSLLRVEAAVKDSARFPEGWAYFDFQGPARGGLRERAEAFPKERCWACHHQHAATDNVFTQFYGPLRQAVQ